MTAIAEAARQSPTPIQAVVLTGGEPLLHEAALHRLVPTLLDLGFSVEVETNGTLSPSLLPDAVHFNVSPKLSNSHMPVNRRLNIPVLEEFLERRSVLKVR